MKQMKKITALTLITTGIITGCVTTGQHATYSRYDYYTPGYDYPYTYYPDNYTTSYDRVTFYHHPNNYWYMHRSHGGYYYTRYKVYQYPYHHHIYYRYNQQM